MKGYLLAATPSRGGSAGSSAELWFEGATYFLKVQTLNFFDCLWKKGGIKAEHLLFLKGFDDLAQVTACMRFLNLRLQDTSN